MTHDELADMAMICKSKGEMDEYHAYISELYSSGLTKLQIEKLLARHTPEPKPFTIQIVQP